MDKNFSAKQTILSRQDLFLLTTLAVGHTITHCIQQGWYIILPSIRGTFVLSDIQYGAIESVRSASSTVLQLPAAALTDIFSRHWGLIISFALLSLGAGFGLLGLASNYLTILFAAILLGAGIAIWHPPAISVLSARFADRRGLALSIHGMGGNLGNAVGPLIVGLIIGAIYWQTASWIIAMPIALCAAVLFLVLRCFQCHDRTQGNGRDYLTALKILARNRIVITAAIANGIRTMGNTSVFVFFSLYCREDLAFSPTKAGFYYALMMVSGIISQPLLGYMSDSLGRKIVIVPSLVLLGIFEIILVCFRSDIGLALIAILIGFFIYSVAAIIQTAIMDMVPVEAGATTVALTFGVSFLFSIPSPTIAGWLSSNYGIPLVFISAGGLMIISALIFAFIPMKSRR